MPAPRRPRPSWPVRLITLLTALSTLTGFGGITPARAAVYDTCSLSRCADARYADSVWAGKGYPTGAGWYSWPDGRYNYTGGRFYNREGQLPAGRTYYEYDVYSRAKGAARDAYRIVVDRAAGVTWFSPNHYTDFYRL
ncbi:ribonuclease N1 [Sphaerisporangium rufum]|uniref:Ribonuclease N1 n=1 Tax=Sphaerisporangium rufum TaxID=1381558 RepID=A0A919R5K7_9ACTN|nr:ribonuclease domain-containing protein [Sphaerisporangium rufum]GII79538.1 ribonuclease N1 [Sphaerisporangium rufum]